MKYQIVAVRDRAADVYGVPQFVGSLGAAIRAFGDECNREDRTNAFFMHPEDFDLYSLGVYDDATGHFDMLPLTKQIAIGKDMKIVRS